MIILNVTLLMNFKKGRKRISCIFCIIVFIVTEGFINEFYEVVIWAICLFRNFRNI